MNVNLVPIVVVLTLIAVVFTAALWPATTMPARVVVLRISLGILMVLLGIAGIFLPILQAWLCFLIAYVLFFPNSKLTMKITRKAAPKMPRTVALLRKLGIGVE